MAIKHWLLGGAVVATGLALGVYKARAADLGGNCCADLEERIADLEATVAKKGNRKVRLVISGQVSKALLWHDIDGLAGTDKLRVIDNPNSGTRLRFEGDAKTSAATSVGFLIELGVDETAGVGLGIPRDDFTIRHSAVWLNTAAGKATIGRTSSATDGIVEIDLSNATVASLAMSVEPVWTYSGLPGIAGGLLNPTPFDGTRSNLVRYDTPTLAGFTGTAAWGGGQSAGGAGVDDMWDVALRYAGEFGGIRVAAGVGYRADRYGTFGAPDTKTVAGSASVMHMATGLFATAAAGRQEDNVVFGDLQMWQVRGGMERKLVDIGATTLFAEYGQHELKSIDVDSTFWGLGVVQAIDAAAADVFVSFRSYDLGGALDAQVGMAGLRVKF